VSGILASTTYIVTDIEADGPDPDRNSMLSFASVAIDAAGTVLGEFEAVLKPRADRKPNPSTIEWWQSHPEAYAAATRDPVDPAEVMNSFVAWVDGFPGDKVFAARPLLFDGGWIDEYLKTFADARALKGPYRERQIFAGAGIDIPTFACALFGLPFADVTAETIRAEWVGDHAHTHRAIDDARGYAHFLGRLLVMSRERAVVGETYRGLPRSAADGGADRAQTGLRRKDHVEA
jgi:DNA polymerase III alpha subunit (gram-positive type)